MKMDSRGEGGFTSSIISLIAVITVLTVFMSVLPAAFISEDGQDMPLYVVDGLSVYNGELRSHHNMDDVVADNDLSGMVLIIRVLGTDLEFRMRSGSTDGIMSYSDSGTFLIDIDGKRTMNARFEMGVWK